MQLRAKWLQLRKSAQAKSGVAAGNAAAIKLNIYDRHVEAGAVQGPRHGIFGFRIPDCGRWRHCAASKRSLYILMGHSVRGAEGGTAVGAHAT